MEGCFRGVAVGTTVHEDTRAPFPYSGEGARGAGAGAGVLDIMHDRRCMYAQRPSHQHKAWTEHGRVFTDQADIDCTEREAP